MTSRRYRDSFLYLYYNKWNSNILATVHTAIL
jgi:hypothetical protein